eukprot:m.251160 g.251160  ORF g.251160 m.251160 type:complete len:113 (+) comp26498_c0_seq1:1367-1705(+)
MQASGPRMAALRLVGRVISNQEMQKTAKVVVTRLAEHAKVKKVLKKRKTYLVHDEADSRLPGDIVRIESCRPISKRKSFKIVEVLQEAPRFLDPVTNKMSTPFSELTRKKQR